MITQGYRYNTNLTCIQLCTDINVSVTLEDFGEVAEKTTCPVLLFL